jgi:hypothetical protein
MSSRTPNQNKALEWFCTERALFPQLSAHPIYYFKGKDGKEVNFNISTIVALWESSRKSTKERAGNRR